MNKTVSTGIIEAISVIRGSLKISDKSFLKKYSKKVVRSVKRVKLINANVFTFLVFKGFIPYWIITFKAKESPTVKIQEFKNTKSEYSPNSYAEV